MDQDQRQLTVCVDIYQFKWSASSYERLLFDADQALFDRIEALPGQLLSIVPLYWYCEDGVVEAYEDGRGYPLRYVVSEHFEMLLEELVREGAYIGAKNNAILIYLSSLPPATRMILWWWHEGGEAQ